MIDLRELEDGELDQLRRHVLTEQERRVNLAAIPEEIAAMAAKFREGGGSEEALQDALTPDQIAALDA